MTFRDPSPRPHLPKPVQFDGRAQIVLDAEAAEAYQGFLRSRDLYLFPMPDTGDGLPTYGVAASQRLLDRTIREEASSASR